MPDETRFDLCFGRGRIHLPNEIWWRIGSDGSSDQFIQLFEPLRWCITGGYTTSMAAKTYTTLVFVCSWMQTERVGFEPTVPVTTRWFSRPEP